MAERKMENGDDDVGNESFDYRTELLSPALAKQNRNMCARQPSWRITMDEHQLPQRHMDSHFGFGFFLTTLSTLIYFIHSYII